jgi:hypothetical protein
MTDCVWIGSPAATTVLRVVSTDFGVRPVALRASCWSQTGARPKASALPLTVRSIRLCRGSFAVVPM